MNLPCPTCKQPIEWSPENPYRPFCSHRCQLIDLGEWASEAHRIPAEPVLFIDEEVTACEETLAESLH